MAQHKLAPFVAEPFPFTLDSRDGEGGTPGKSDGARLLLRHPIHTAIRWQERLDREEGLTRAQLARDEGITKVRVTQMLQLLDLPKDIVEYLSALTTPAGIKTFSIRRLLRLAKLPPSRQAEAFTEMNGAPLRRAG